MLSALLFTICAAQFLCLSFGQLYNDSKVKIFLVGDSFDRYITYYWCNYQFQLGFNVTLFRWGSDSIKYGDRNARKQPSLACHSSSGASLTALHIFGSKPYGPYLYINPRGDPYVDTVFRVKKGVDLYREQFGVPSIVYFHTSCWDANTILNRENIGNNASDPDFIYTLNASVGYQMGRMRELIALFPEPNVRFAFRGALANVIKAPFLRESNVAVRKMATEELPCVGFVDIHTPFWDVININRFGGHGNESHFMKVPELFIDDLYHPGPIAGGPLGEILIAPAFDKTINVSSSQDHYNASRCWPSTSPHSHHHHLHHSHERSLLAHKNLELLLSCQSNGSLPAGYQRQIVIRVDAVESHHRNNDSTSHGSQSVYFAGRCAHSYNESLLLLWQLSNNTLIRALLFTLRIGPGDIIDVGELAHLKAAARMVGSEIEVQGHIPEKLLQLVNNEQPLVLHDEVRRVSCLLHPKCGLRWLINALHWVDSNKTIPAAAELGVSRDAFVNTTDPHLAHMLTVESLQIENPCEPKGLLKPVLPVLNWPYNP